MADHPADREEAEERFLPILRERVQPLLAVRRGPGGDARVWSMLAEESRSVESFLEDYGARDNERFLYLTELVSSTRGFAIAAYTLRLIEKRLGQRYPTDPTGDGHFEERLGAALGFVEGAVHGLMNAINEELTRFGPGDDSTPEAEPNPLPEPLRLDLPRFRLPRSLDADRNFEPHHEVVAIASKFMAVHRILSRQEPERRWTTLEERRLYVRDVSDEQQCRFFETRILNLIGRYDTIVRGTMTEKDQPLLREMRAGLGIIRRVSRVMTELVHFHERYERDLRSTMVRDRIRCVVKEEDLLECVLGFCTVTIAQTCEETSQRARDLLKAFTRQGRVSCQLPEGVMMHVRPVSLIAKIVQHHGTPVTVHYGDQSCYAGSVVQFLMLAASHPEARELHFEGDAEVLRDLELFFSSGLGEQGPLPTELGYLRR